MRPIAAWVPPARLVALAAGLMLGGCAVARPDAGPPGEAQPGLTFDAGAEFVARMTDYIELHRLVEGSMPPLAPDPTPQQIDERQRELARLIEQKRARAEPGTIFTSRVRGYFRTQLRRALSGPDGALLRSSIMDENPGRIPLRVNARYPDSVPLSTMPFQVLTALPDLPEELEYRFIGDRLVLLDAHAHLVVDYMDNALPK